jgi:hypothetical protein
MVNRKHFFYILPISMVLQHTTCQTEARASGSHVTSNVQAYNGSSASEKKVFRVPLYNGMSVP